MSIDMRSNVHLDNDTEIEADTALQTLDLRERNALGVTHNAIIVWVYSRAQVDAIIAEATKLLATFPEPADV